MSTAAPAITPLLERVQAVADRSGVFGPTRIDDACLICPARAAAAPASYRLFAQGDRLWVSLVMADRWLSESVETDLLHTGDKVEDLLEEELVEQGAPASRLKVEHFRSDDLLFTFRSPLPIELTAEQAPAAAAFLLAYEACFRNLGDLDTTGG